MTDAKLVLPYDVSTLHSKLLAANMPDESHRFVTDISKILATYTNVLNAAKQPMTSVTQQQFVKETKALPFCADVLLIIVKYLQVPGFPVQEKCEFEARWECDCSGHDNTSHCNLIRIVGPSHHEFKHIQRQVNRLQGSDVLMERALEQIELMKSRGSSIPSAEMMIVDERWQYHIPEYINMLNRALCFAQQSSKITGTEIRSYDLITKVHRIMKVLHFSCINAFLVDTHQWSPPPRSD